MILMAASVVKFPATEYLGIGQLKKISFPNKKVRDVLPLVAGIF